MSLSNAKLHRVQPAQPSFVSLFHAWGLSDCVLQFLRVADGLMLRGVSKAFRSAVTLHRWAMAQNEYCWSGKAHERRIRGGLELWSTCFPNTRHCLWNQSPLEGIVVARLLPELRHIRLKKNADRCPSVSVLSDESLSWLPKLESLYFCLRSQDDPEVYLSRLTCSGFNLPALRSLSLFCEAPEAVLQVTDETFARLPCLEELSLEWPLADFTDKLFAHLPQLRVLDWACPRRGGGLYGRDSRLTDAVFVPLVHLQKLSLRDYDEDDMFSELVNPMRGWNQLASLTLGQWTCNQFTDEALRLPNLTHLSLDVGPANESDSNLTDEAFCNVPNLTSLTMVGLPPLCSAALFVPLFGQLLELNLCYCDFFSGNEIPEFDVDSIMAGMTRLVSLTLGAGLKITDRAFVNMKNLTVLDLRPLSGFVQESAACPLSDDIFSFMPLLEEFRGIRYGTAPQSKKDKPFSLFAK